MSKKEDWFTEWCEQQAALEKKRIAALDPNDQLVEIHYLKLDPSRVRIKEKVVCGRTLYVPQIRRKIFWHSVYSYGHLSNDELLYKLTTGKGLIWDAWDAAGRRRYIKGEPIFESRVGSSIHQHGDKPIKRVWL